MPAFHLVELHPVLVHFPIALLLTSVALDFAAIVFRRASVTDAASWCLVLGVVGAGAALLSGKISAGQTNTAVAASILHLHKLCAVGASMLFGTLLIVRVVWLAPRVLATIGSAVPGVVSVVTSVDGRLKMVLPALYAPRLPRTVVAFYLFLSVIAVVLMGATGYLGGAMVYDHGVGTPGIIGQP